MNQSITASQLWATAERAAMWLSWINAFNRKSLLSLGACQHAKAEPMENLRQL